MHQPTRFKWVIEGESRGCDPVSDVDLAPSAPFALIPSLGALVRSWLLLIPRHQVLSLRDLSPPERRKAMRMAREIATSLCSPGAKCAIFEHGAVRAGSRVGCGTDQAHLHIVPLNFSLRGAVSADRNVQWTRSSREDDPWQDIEQTSEYLLLADHEDSLIGYPKEPCSQYFRKIIAAELGRPTEWDYRKFPQYDNVRGTLNERGFVDEIIRAA